MELRSGSSLAQHSISASPRLFGRMLSGGWLVSDPDSGNDSRRMFWATTTAEAALGWAARRSGHLGLERLYVWEVELDHPEVDVNLHSTRWQVPVTSVMAPSGRFVRVISDIPLAEYQGG
jgi:hypothetical protein